MAHLSSESPCLFPMARKFNSKQMFKTQIRDNRLAKNVHCTTWIPATWLSNRFVRVMDINRLIIDNVRKFEFLYDKRNRSFKNKLMRENAWETIAHIVGESASTVEATWNMLRNRYCLERRKMRTTPSGSAAETTWKYFRVISFIEEHIVPRKTTGNVDRIEEGSQDSSNIWETPIMLSSQEVVAIDEEDEEEEVLETSTRKRPLEDCHVINSSNKQPALESSPGPSRTPINCVRMIPPEQTPKKRGKKCQVPNENFNDVIKDAFTSLSNLTDKENEQEQNEDMLFAQSLGLTLQHIQSRKQKAQCKIRLLQIVEEYEED